MNPLAVSATSISATPSDSTGSGGSLRPPPRCGSACLPGQEDGGGSPCRCATPESQAMPGRCTFCLFPWHLPSLARSDGTWWGPGQHGLGPALLSLGSLRPLQDAPVPPGTRRSCFLPWVPHSHPSPWPVAWSQSGVHLYFTWTPWVQGPFSRHARPLTTERAPRQTGTQGGGDVPGRLIGSTAGRAWWGGRTCGWQGGGERYLLLGLAVNPPELF